MTLLELGETTLVLEKVCAYEYIDRPLPPGETADKSNIKSIRIYLDGGHALEIHGRGVIVDFIKAMRSLKK
ncbi:MAG: hypothetical protein KC422_16875 [Trueperaceae bacterium]|nr:hypothetical protein [Trueperaceae bacterium]